MFYTIAHLVHLNSHLHFFYVVSTVFCSFLFHMLVNIFVCPSPFIPCWMCICSYSVSRHLDILIYFYTFRVHVKFGLFIILYALTLYNYFLPHFLSSKASYILFLLLSLIFVIYGVCVCVRVFLNL